MAFKSEFMKVFKEGLEPYGFRRMKGTDFFGKLVNNEILLYISYKPCSAINRGMKAFDIISGGQTVYSYELSAHQLQLAARTLNKFTRNDTFARANIGFEYNDSNCNSVIEDALEQTIKFAVPALQDITDLRSCIDFLTVYLMGSLYPADKIYRDSVLLIIANDHESFDSKLNLGKKYLYQYYKGDLTSVDYQSSLGSCETVTHKLIDSRDRVWASKELQDKVFSEAERRAETNKAVLREYGFEI